MDAAIFGFVGVIVGGLISAGATWTIAVRREGVEARRERDERARKMVVAARVVKQDLALVGALEHYVEKREWWREELKASLPSWAEYRADIAAAVSVSEWETVAQALQVIDLMNIMYEDVSNPGPTGEKMSEAEQKYLQGVMKRINDAELLLESHAGLEERGLTNKQHNT